MRYGAESVAYGIEHPEFRNEMTEDSLGHLLIWADSLPEHQIRRAWHMHSLLRCFQTDTQVDLATATGCLACSHPFPDGWCFGDFSPRVASILVRTDARKCECSNAADMEFIRGEFEKAPGGYGPFNDHLAKIVAGPVLRDAAARDAFEVIEELHRKLPDLQINSEILSGSLRESAVHVATGTGSLRALELLLQLGMDPNAEDHVRETPLHYASLTGQEACTKVLLRHGALSTGANAYCETPLDVAKQNPGEYLGVCTKGVCQLLEDPDAADESLEAVGGAAPAQPAGSNPSWPQRQCNLLKAQLEAERAACVALEERYAASQIKHTEDLQAVEAAAKTAAEMAAKEALGSAEAATRKKVEFAKLQGRLEGVSVTAIGSLCALAIIAVGAWRLKVGISSIGRRLNG